MNRLGRLLAAKFIIEAKIQDEMNVGENVSDDEIMKRAKEKGKFCDINQLDWFDTRITYVKEL